VSIDAADLELEEKALILYRHARAARLPSAAISCVRTHGAMIVEHPHFTPERISRFVATRLRTLGEATPRLLRAAIASEIAEPTRAMAASFEALSPEHRALLVALVDQPPGPVSERELAAASRRHAREALPRSPSVLVDRLSDHFIRLVPPASVAWVHPSWRDLVIERLASDADGREAFLRACSLDGLLLALSRGGGPAGTRERPLLKGDRDWDLAAGRLFELVPELADSDLSRLLSALEDALADTPGDPELQALATAALGRIASCWERAGVYASRAVLEHWRLVASLLAERPREPHVRALWEESAHHRPERRLASTRFLESGSGERFAGVDERRVEERALVERILADL